MDDDTHATIRELLRRARQRYTLGRRQLVEMLLEVDRPVTIPELLELGARQSQSSLYRNLAVMEQAGAVRRLASVDDVARYELDEELTGHHHHLVCSICGRIDDIVLDEAFEKQLHKAVGRTSEASGYELSAHHLEMVGACPDCH